MHCVFLCGCVLIGSKTLYLPILFHFSIAMHNRNGTVPLIGGIPYEVVLELSMLEMSMGSVQLLWSGAGLPGIDSTMRIVPKSRLAPKGDSIKGSPFRVTVS